VGIHTKGGYNMPVKALEALSDYAERRRAEQIDHDFFGEASYGADFLAWDIASLNLVLLLEDTPCTC
tara:strand:+ start:2350 stop:2550 length:201 start_codon:yes stop_codon:yes gene_type:complete